MVIKNLRKYFFLNILSILGYAFWIAYYIYFTADILPAYDDPVITPGFGYRLVMFLCGFAILITLVLSVLEILIRHFIIEKYFHFKFNVNIKLPKFLDVFYSVIFIAGNFLSLLPFLILIAVKLKLVF